MSCTGMSLVVRVFYNLFSRKINKTKNTDYLGTGQVLLNFYGHFIWQWTATYFIFWEETATWLMTSSAWIEHVASNLGVQTFWAQNLCWLTRHSIVNIFLWICNLQEVAFNDNLWLTRGIYSIVNISKCLWLHTFQAKLRQCLSQQATF